MTGNWYLWSTKATQSRNGYWMSKKYGAKVMTSWSVRINEKISYEKWKTGIILLQIMSIMRRSLIVSKILANIFEIVRAFTVVVGHSSAFGTHCCTATPRTWHVQPVHPFWQEDLIILQRFLGPGDLVTGIGNNKSLFSIQANSPGNKSLFSYHT